MSRPAVSQWLAKTATPDDEAPDDVIGKDGTIQSTRNKSRSGVSVSYAAWEFKGPAGKMLVKVQSEMETLARAPFGPVLGTDRVKGIRYQLARVADAAGTLIRRLDGEEPDAELPEPEPGATDASVLARVAQVMVRKARRLAETGTRCTMRDFTQMVNARDRSYKEDALALALDRGFRSG